MYRGCTDLMRNHYGRGQASRDGKQRVPVHKTPLDSLYSGVVRSLSRLYPMARVIDSSPYDRSMRRIHNYMKENEAFRSDVADYREIQFPPLSAWVGLTA